MLEGMSSTAAWVSTWQSSGVSRSQWKGDKEERNDGTNPRDRRQRLVDLSTMAPEALASGVAVRG